MASQIGANELKRKDMILIENQPWQVMDVTFASPSARGASTMVKVRVKNLLNGAVQDKNLRTSEKFTEADVEKVPASFLYSDPDAYHFMDDATYEQFSFSIEKISDVKGFIKEGSQMQALKFNGVPVSLEFPVYVELKVIEAEPTRDSGGGNVTKLAKVETGLEVKVPQYIKEGDIVRVNTQTGEVSGRA